MQLPILLPFIGPLLARHRVSKMARAARKGDTAAVRELCSLLVVSDDCVIQETAGSALRDLTSQETVNTFCGMVTGAGDLHPRLVEIALHRKYAPSDLPARALFYAATGQKDCLAAIDSGSRHPLLSEAYREADLPTRKRILMAAAEAEGMVTIFAQILLGDPATGDPAVWSGTEWETVITGLIEERDWDALWPLIFSAPPPLAVRSLHALNAGAWKPPAEDRHLFNDLIAALPASWDYLFTKDPTDLVIACPDSQCLKLVFSRDGSLLAAAHCDGTISVWQRASGRLISRWSEGSGLAGTQIVLPDTGSLVSLSNEGVLQCRHIPEGSVRWSYDDPHHRITIMHLSTNGEYLLTGDTGGCVSLLDWSTGSETGGFTVCLSPVTALADTPDGGFIASGHKDGRIHYWNRRTGVHQSCPSYGGDPVRTLAFSDDGTLLTALFEDAQPAVWNLTSGELVHSCTGFSAPLGDHAASTAARISLLSEAGNMLRLWRWADIAPCTSIPFYSRHPCCCTITAEGTLCVAGCDDGTIRIFTSPEGKLIRDFRGHSRPVSACAISPDGSQFATASWDGTVTLRDLPSGEIRRTLQRQVGPVTAFGISLEGTLLIAATADGIARLYSRDGGTLLRSIDLYTPSAKAIAVSPDGKYLACAGSDATLRLWNLLTGSLVAGQEHLGTTLRSLTYSVDGDLLISGGWDGVVRYWRVPDLYPVGTGKGHSSIVNCCAVTPDGSQLVTGSNDMSIRIWNRAAGRASAVIRDAKTEVSACAILPDGSLFAAGSADGMIRLYSLPYGKPEGIIQTVPGKITAIVPLPGGELCIAGYDSGSLVICSIKERRFIRSLPVHADAISGAALVSGGEFVATGGMDGMVRVTRLPWTKNLVHASLEDLSWVYGETEGNGSAMRSPWMFLYRMLAGRFRGEIGICTPSHEAGQFDIQIAG